MILVLISISEGDLCVKNNREIIAELTYPYLAVKGLRKELV
jgi:hypothetical protein